MSVGVPVPRHCTTWHDDPRFASTVGHSNTLGTSRGTTGPCSCLVGSGRASGLCRCGSHVLRPGLNGLARATFHSLPCSITESHSWHATAGPSRYSRSCPLLIPPYYATLAARIGQCLARTGRCGGCSSRHCRIGLCEACRSSCWLGRCVNTRPRSWAHQLASKKYALISLQNGNANFNGLLAVGICEK